MKKLMSFLGSQSTQSLCIKEIWFQELASFIYTDQDINTLLSGHIKNFSTYGTVAPVCSMEFM